MTTDPNPTGIALLEHYRQAGVHVWMEARDGEQATVRAQPSENMTPAEAAAFTVYAQQLEQALQAERLLAGLLAPFREGVAVGLERVLSLERGQGLSILERLSDQDLLRIFGFVDGLVTAYKSGQA